MQNLKKVKQLLHSFSEQKNIPNYMRFFKTKKGEYGYGDKFLGIKVPNIRKVVKEFSFILSMDDIKELLYSEFHEERMFALLYLVRKYKSKQFTADIKDEIYNFYINNTKQINNWDLIDVTAPHIVGQHLLNKDRSILYEFAKSDDLWKKRISIISTFAFIKNEQYDDTLNLAKILLYDTHDLIHKAVGWSLRNVGIKDLNTELKFLNPTYKTMPRTMLRYAIEKFDEPLRQKYLKGEVRG